MWGEGPFYGWDVSPLVVRPEDEDAAQADIREELMAVLLHGARGDVAAEGSLWWVEAGGLPLWRRLVGAITERAALTRARADAYPLSRSTVLAWLRRRNVELGGRPASDLRSREDGAHVVRLCWVAAGADGLQPWAVLESHPILGPIAWREVEAWPSYPEDAETWRPSKLPDDQAELAGVHCWPCCASVAVCGCPTMREALHPRAVEAFPADAADFALATGTNMAPEAGAHARDAEVGTALPAPAAPSEATPRPDSPVEGPPTCPDPGPEQLRLPAAPAPPPGSGHPSTCDRCGQAIHGGSLPGVSRVTPRTKCDPSMVLDGKVVPPTRGGRCGWCKAYLCVDCLRLDACGIVFCAEHMPAPEPTDEPAAEAPSRVTASAPPEDVPPAVPSTPGLPAPADAVRSLFDLDGQAEPARPKRRKSGGKTSPQPDH